MELRRAACILVLAVAVIALFVVPVASQAPTSPVPRDDGIGALRERVLKLLPSPVKVRASLHSRGKAEAYGSAGVSAAAFLSRKNGNMGAHSRRPLSFVMPPRADDAEACCIGNRRAARGHQDVRRHPLPGITGGGAAGRRPGA